MNKVKTLKKKVTNYLYDHYFVKQGLSYFLCFIVCAFSAALYSFGFNCFVTPGSADGLTFVTGGVGGVAQNIFLIMQMLGSKIDAKSAQSIFYFVVNIPIITFAFFKIGKRFAIFSLINVALSSVFIRVFDASGFTAHLAQNSFISGSLISRAIFAGVIIGIGSALSFKVDTSCGGIDVFCYYFAMRKSTNVGKYSTAVNLGIVGLYCILSIAKSPSNWDMAFVGLLYSCIYLITIMMVVDIINVRNKKVQIELITSRADMSSILIANFPHGTTVMDARGGYTGAEKFVIFMIVSSNEVGKVIKLAKRVDEHGFYCVTPLSQVYGKFFIKPVE